MPAVVKVNNLKKDYILGNVVVAALRGVSFEIKKNESVAIVGPSGCGKSTLMHLLGCLDRPTSGTILIEGADVSTLNDNQLAQIRNRQIGFVFQSFNLLPRMTALENIELPLIYNDIQETAQQRKDKALATLDKVGLADRANHKPPELSGGERQRVAIARALVSNPSMILADEPTGNLDSKSGDEVMQIFEKLNQEGATLVVVTHDHSIAARCYRRIHMHDGEITADEKK